MRLVVDATPLIYLGTIDRLEFLAELSAEIVSPPDVYEEVVTTGREQGHPDARRVERAFEAGIITQKTLPDEAALDRFRRHPQLSEADAAVLAMAMTTEAIAVVDDHYCRSVAAVEGVVTRGSAWIVLSLLKNGTIDAETARDAIDDMVHAGWYCGTDLYAEIVQTIDRLGVDPG